MQHSATKAFQGFQCQFNVQWSNGSFFGLQLKLLCTEISSMQVFCFLFFCFFLLFPIDFVIKHDSLDCVSQHSNKGNFLCFLVLCLFELLGVESKEKKIYTKCSICLLLSWMFVLKILKLCTAINLMQGTERIHSAGFSVGAIRVQDICQLVAVSLESSSSVIPF